MKSDTIISYILNKSLFFGFIMSYLINNASYFSFIAIIIGYLLGYLSLKFILKHKINNIIILIIDILVLFYILYNLTFQTSYFYLSKTPSIIIIIIFLIVIIYGATKKLDGLLNLSTILLPINILLIILGILFNIENFHIINNLSNIDINFIKVIFMVILISTLPILIYTNTNDNYSIKNVLNGYIFGGITIILINLNCTFTLGTTLISYYKFPEYMVYKKIRMITFIERIENIISLYSLIDFIILGILIILNIKKNIKK